MSIVRKAQLLTLLLSAGVGLAVLFTLDKFPALSFADSLLTPGESGTITAGYTVADPHPEHARQRVLRKVFAPNSKAPDYLLCSIDDDPDGINAYGIYHPADLAITLENLRKLQMRSLFITTHLQWPELDLVERNMLSSAIAEFEHATIATPVGRSAKGEDLPDYLLRSSIPLDAVGGSTGSIPLVNKLSLPPNITIPQNTFAGFSQIESEESTEGQIPMIARWGDRVIFYAPLLEHLLHLGLKPSDLSVELGQSIRLGNHGNIIPIDEFGQLKTDYRSEEAPFTITSAYSGEASMIGITQTAAILSADGKASSDFSSISEPYQKLAQIMHTPTVGEKTTLTRFPLWLETLLVVDLSLLAAWLLAYRSARRHSAFLITLFTLGGTLLVLNRLTTYWSPSAPYLITLFTGWLLTSLLALPVRKKLQAAQAEETPEDATPALEQTANKKDTQSIHLPKPKKENHHTGKEPEQEFSEESIPEGDTMFSNKEDSLPSEKQTETQPADDTKASQDNASDKASGLTGKVKIDTQTEYPFFPADSGKDE